MKNMTPALNTDYRGTHLAGLRELARKAPRVVFYALYDTLDIEGQPWAIMYAEEVRRFRDE